MLQRNNRRIFLIFTITAIAMLILASGLSGILKPPETFVRAEGKTSSAAGGVDFRFSGDGLWVVYLILAVYVLTLITIMITPGGRRRFLAIMVLIAAALLALFLLPRKEPEVVQTELPGAESDIVGAVNEMIEPTIIAEVVEQPQESKDWLVNLAGVLLAAALVALLVVTLVPIINRRRDYSVTDKIAQQAQTALTALDMGGNYRDTIIRCYADMSRVLLEEKGVERSIGMTPHEFEQTLVRLQFPEQPVHDLTHLFEEVRYGSIEQSEQRIDLAKSSLHQIIAFCVQSLPNENTFEMESNSISTKG